jgi:hypothetical protein
MPKLSRAQRDIITQAAAEGGLVVTDVIDRKVVEQVVWHKYCLSADQEDGSILLMATETGKAAIAAVPAKPADPKASDAALEPAPPSAATPWAPKGKLGTMVALLRRPQGASVEDLVGATGWQSHSVRGAMSGSVKKKLGLEITSEKTDGKRIYRIASADAQ